MITIDDFAKVEIKIGKIISAEKVENADKLLKLIFDFGTEQRQIMSAIAEYFPDPSELIGKVIPVITNLEYRKFRGHESQGMILAASDETGKPVFITPESPIALGTKLF